LGFARQKFETGGENLASVHTPEDSVDLNICRYVKES
jgi:hypothetical protein